MRQGDGLSPILFAISINDISKKLSVVDSDRDMNMLSYHTTFNDMSFSTKKFAMLYK